MPDWIGAQLTFLTGRSSAWIDGGSPKTTARSMTLASSRTLPWPVEGGQLDQGVVGDPQEILFRFLGKAPEKKLGQLWDIFLALAERRRRDGTRARGAAPALTTAGRPVTPTTPDLPPLLLH